MTKSSIDHKTMLDAAALLAAAATLGVAATPAVAQPQMRQAVVKHRITSLASKGSETQLRAQAARLQTTEPVKAAILNAAIDKAKAQPGFNPAAISIVFGLKW